MANQLSYNEFREEVLKLRGEKKFKVTNSYRIIDVWNASRKDPRFKQLMPFQIGKIVKTFNEYLLNRLISGLAIKFPNGMGKLEVRKYKTKLEYRDGKLFTNYPIDWKTTLHYWKEDPKAREQKKLIRKEEKYIFKVYFIKREARFKYKSHYEFSLNRGAKAKLREKIINKEFDTFII